MKNINYEDLSQIRDGEFYLVAEGEGYDTVIYLFRNGLPFQQLPIYAFFEYALRTQTHLNDWEDELDYRIKYSKDGEIYFHVLGDRNPTLKLVVQGKTLASTIEEFLNSEYLKEIKGHPSRETVVKKINLKLWLPNNYLTVPVASQKFLNTLRDNRGTHSERNVVFHLGYPTNYKFTDSYKEENPDIKVLCYYHEINKDYWKHFGENTFVRNLTREVLATKKTKDLHLPMFITDVDLLLEYVSILKNYAERSGLKLNVKYNLLIEDIKDIYSPLGYLVNEHLKKIRDNKELPL